MKDGEFLDFSFAWKLFGLKFSLKFEFEGKLKKTPEISE